MLNKNIHQQPHEMPKHITSHSFEISPISQILVTQVVVLSVNRHFLSQSLFFSCRYCLNVGQYQLSDFFVENCGFQKLFAFSALCCWSRINFKFLSQNRNFNPNDKPLGNQQACSVQIQDTERFFFRNTPSSLILETHFETFPMQAYACVSELLYSINRFPRHFCLAKWLRILKFYGLFTFSVICEDVRKL